MATAKADRLCFTGDDEADRLLVEEPFALLVGFALDQQVPLQRAFSAPLELKRRIGTLDPAAIALPRDVRDEARRAILNYVGCALGGCREPAMDVAIQALGPFFGAPTASVLGREERMDPLHASLMNGISSHVHDYDDTTPGNYSHPTSPVASAVGWLETA